MEEGIDLPDSMRHRAERAAGAKLGHVPEYVVTEGMHSCRCSCGWQGDGYIDGHNFAHMDWVLHIRDKGAKIVYPPTALPIL